MYSQEKNRISNSIINQLQIKDVVIKDKNYFYQNEESLNDMLKNGVNPDKISIHAWLTLPSMEIIDLSLLQETKILN